MVPILNVMTPTWESSLSNEWLYIFYEKESPMQHHDISNIITMNQSIEKLYKCKMCFMPFSSSDKAFTNKN